MEEKTLLKISLLVGLFGVMLFYLISSQISLEPVSEIKEIEEEEEVKIKGLIGKIVEKEKVIFLEVLNEKIERTKVVLFKEEGVNLKEGDYIEITGTVEEYKGEKEIIGNKVVKK